MLSPLPRKSTLANTCLSSKTHIKDPMYGEIFLSSPQMKSRPLPPLSPFGTHHGDISHFTLQFLLPIPVTPFSFFFFF